MLLFLTLISVGIQALIILRNQIAGAPLFGPSEDTIVFIGLGMIEAFIFIIWIQSAVFDTSERVRKEKCDEEKAEIRQTSRLPSERGDGIAKQVTALGDRVDVQVDVARRYLRSFFVVVALLGLVAAALVRAAGLG